MSTRTTVTISKNTHLAGLEAVRARVRALAESKVYVGVPAGKSEPDGTSLGQVAAWTEFGTRNSDGSVRSPERPFLRTGINRAVKKMGPLNRSNLRQVVDGRMAVGTALDLLGVFAVGEVKQGMVDGPFAANAPSTIAKKGSDKPTIDSGNLRQAVTHVVTA